MRHYDYDKFPSYSEWVQAAPNIFMDKRYTDDISLNQEQFCCPAEDIYSAYHVPHDVTVHIRLKISRGLPATVHHTSVEWPNSFVRHLIRSQCFWAVRKAFPEWLIQSVVPRTEEIKHSNDDRPGGPTLLLSTYKRGNLTSDFHSRRCFGQAYMISGTNSLVWISFFTKVFINLTTRWLRIHPLHWYSCQNSYIPYISQ